MAKILIVEDDNNLSEIYQARMMAEGYTIVAAHDGEEALALAAKEKPDLIISDVMMPKISGFEMLDILRNTQGLKDTKVIMLTALGQAEDKTRADALGADRYLVKSQVTLEDIVTTAQALLNSVAAPTQPVGTAAPAQPAVSAPPTAVVSTPVTPAPGTAAPNPAPAATPIPVAQAPAAVAPQAITPAPQQAAPAMPTPVPVAATPTTTIPVAIAVPQPPVPEAPAPAIPTANTPQPVAVAPAPPVQPVATPPAPAVAEPTPQTQSAQQENATVQNQIANFENQPVTPAPAENPVQAQDPTTSPTSTAVVDDKLVTDAVNDLMSGTEPTQAAPAPVVTPTSTTEPTSISNPATAPAASVEPSEQVTPAPATETNGSSDDSAPVARKKIIQPITNEPPKPDLGSLLAAEEAKNSPAGFSQVPQQPVAMPQPVQDQPHQPGNVFTPTVGTGSNTGNNTGIDPNSISL